MFSYDSKTTEDLDEAKGTPSLSGYESPPITSAGVGCFLLIWIPTNILWLLIWLFWYSQSGRHSGLCGTYLIGVLAISVITWIILRRSQEF